ncbi:iron-containing alcohol dehydrogenase [Conexibacter sp. JD483]|uniref:iron-containing alcohol dehydrogenase n=1 Tax=unclassified Conexibacter TaxID=2627773 RepID=UPI00272014E2|nr:MULTISPECIES: iron-containing alcohol dehydrogenase [unclassified Conexibacter]MDO8186510.1 iron-containing alcohol dehydrogenase [Conexibacter sp. CPCC 205706]MDO8200079.1 iron-containing alcohol dehydrogenase [Conexibacter sp. CPCC 205762]MDR9372210.1 iron-containing alcohol dehydrogenase [Conexibacter sp. JD483]
MTRAAYTRETLAQRVVFGDGAVAQLGAEVERLGGRRVLLVATPGCAPLVAAAADGLGRLLADRFEQAAMHTPVAVTASAQRVAIARRADTVVSVGGGSAVGLGKALALRERLLHVAVPTTYAGSEATPVLGETRDGRKTTRRDPALVPRTVVYDPLLTHGLPAGLSGTSGLNAIAHAVEALYAAEGDPLTDVQARAGIAAMAEGLRGIFSQGDIAAARRAALAGAWHCGSVLATAPMGLHHQLCHVLGGSFDLPHSETHAVLLPHVAAFNAPAAPAALQAVAETLGAPPDHRAAASALLALAAAVDAPASLRQLGFAGTPEQVQQVVAQVLERPYPNPRTPDADGLRTLLRAATEGEEPR